MGLSARYSTESANAGANAEAALANGGYLRIYDGEQPPSADTPVSGQQLLAELRFASPAFAPARLGVAEAHGIAADESARATGKATWYRVYRSDGISPLWDGSVGKAGASINLGSVDIQAGGVVEVRGYTFTRIR